MTGVAVLVTGAMGIILTVWVALYLRLTNEGRHARPPWWRRVLGLARGQVARLRDLRKRATRFVFPQVSGWARRLAARHPRKLLRWGMTPEAVRPMLPPLRRRVTRAAAKARRRMLSPGLPGLRRLGVRSRPHRRLAPGDAQTVVWLRGLSTAHPRWQAHALAARIAVLAMVTAHAADSRWPWLRPGQWQDDTGSFTRICGEF